MKMGQVRWLSAPSSYKPELIGKHFN